MDGADVNSRDSDSGAVDKADVHSRGGGGGPMDGADVNSRGGTPATMEEADANSRGGAACTDDWADVYGRSNGKIAVDQEPGPPGRLRPAVERTAAAAVEQDSAMDGADVNSRMRGP